MYASDAPTRLAAARALNRRARRRLLEPAGRAWADKSAGSANAWLVLVGTRAPDWQDPLFEWKDEAPTLGDPHPGLFYPDRLGFWTEVRRWITVLVQASWPTASREEALSVASVLHGQEPGAALASIATARPRVILALDDQALGLLPATRTVDRRGVTIRDPHRAQQSYAGWWATTDDGVVVGKAPQHPAAHKFYRRADLDAFLAAAPLH